MKRRTVRFGPHAAQDLVELYDWIAEASGPQTAIAYVEKLEAFCRSLETASERGQRRDDIREGLRIASFRRRVTIAFSVDHDRVMILRLFRAGRNWEDDPV